MEFSYTNFDNVINAFGKTKEQLRLLKDENEEYTKIIKDTMRELNMPIYSFGEYTVKLSKRISENFNEQKLLNVCKQEWSKHHPNEPIPFIKTKEYVDMEGLERVIYRGEFDASTLNDCKETKTIETLILKKQKE